MNNKKNLLYLATTAGLIYNLFTKNTTTDTCHIPSNDDNILTSTNCHYTNCSVDSKVINSTTKQNNNCENFSLNIKMNQIYYSLRNLNKIHQILSSAIRVQDNIYDTKIIVKQNLCDIKNSLANIKLIIKGKYYYKKYYDTYVTTFHILVKHLANNCPDNIVVIMKLDTIMEKWYRLHEIYYINSKA